MRSTEKKRILKISLLAFCGIGVLCLIALSVAVFLMLPLSSSEDMVNFEVPVGSSSLMIAKRLVKQNLIRSEYAFRLIVKRRGTGKRLRAGTYVLRRNMALWHIIDEFEKGQVNLVSWTVPEGLTVSAIAELWETTGYGTAEAFQEAAELECLLEQLDFKTNL